jgi:integrase
VYLMRRKGSQNWRIRLQYPDEPVFERSLDTSDYKAAEVVALQKYADKIADHKARLLEARPRIELAWRREYAPGLHATDDGHIFATERELHFLDAKGVTIRTTTNGGPEHRIVNLERRLGIPYGWIGLAEEAAARPTVAAKTTDDTLLDTYIKHANLSARIERETRDIWALYKALTGNKRLKDATRDDGRKLVAHFEGEGLKSATIRKKIGWLAATVNLAIKERKDNDPLKLTFNPFISVVPKRDDKQTRLPLSHADMKAIKAGLDRLDAADQVLLRLLATTGMRLSEAFEIEGELRERGCRYVIVGKKTPQSERRVPFPAGVIPFLPKKIRGPLFKGGAPAASKRLNRFLNDCGIVDPRKVLHSLRHRAQDRLRAVECPQDIRWALLGHEDETVAEDYGKGFSVPQLKRWIDRIGC